MDKTAESCSNRTDGCAGFEALMCFPGAAETTTTMVNAGIIDELIDADVVVSGYIAEYNASLVSVSLIAAHAVTGAVLWSGDNTVRVGWVRLDVDSAAERAVGMLM